MTKAYKRWSVNAICEGLGPVSYYFDGRPLAKSSQAEREDVSPVEHLLIGIAGCLALSCRAIFLKRHLRDINLEVVVTGTKSSGLANGLSAIVVTAIFRGHLTAAEAVAIVDDARPLCTVTNSVLLTPTLKYDVRAIQPRIPTPALRYAGTTAAKSTASATAPP